MITDREYFNLEDIVPSIHIDFRTGNKWVNVEYSHIPKELQEFSFFLLCDFMNHLKENEVLHDFYITNYKGKEIRK